MKTLPDIIMSQLVTIHFEIPSWMTWYSSIFYRNQGYRKRSEHTAFWSVTCALTHWSITNCTSLSDSITAEVHHGAFNHHIQQNILEKGERREKAIYTVQVALSAPALRTLSKDQAGVGPCESVHRSWWESVPWASWSMSSSHYAE